MVGGGAAVAAAQLSLATGLDMFTKLLGSLVIARSTEGGTSPMMHMYHRVEDSLLIVQCRRHY